MSTKTFKVIEAGQREAAPLKHLKLPDDLFDREEPEQAVIDGRRLRRHARHLARPSEGVVTLLLNHCVSIW